MFVSIARQVRLGAATAAIALATFSQSFGAEGPFAGLSGSWSGGGSIAMADGSHERIHCRAHYTAGGGGHSLSQSLHCASASTSLQISANVVDQGGSLSGSWSETTRGVTGSISGHVSGSTIRAQVVGGGFSAGVGINLHGDSQSVTITPSSNTDIKTVTVSMHRG